VLQSRQIVFHVTGRLGEVSADVATPLAVVLAELLQNAVEHAFTDGAGTHHISVAMRSSARCLTIEVRDDGVGLPDGFDINDTESLGLSIVRDLVRSQLEGTISMERAPFPLGSGEQSASGTAVTIELPVVEPGRSEW
jgi:two-component sensor histidine kinase